MESFIISKFNKSKCVGFGGEVPCRDCVYCCSCMKNYTVFDLTFTGLIRNKMSDECIGCYKTYIITLSRQIKDHIDFDYVLI